MTGLIRTAAQKLLQYHASGKGHVLEPPTSARRPGVPAALYQAPEEADRALRHLSAFSQWGLHNDVWWIGPCFRLTPGPQVTLSHLAETRCGATSEGGDQAAMVSVQRLVVEVADGDPAKVQRLLAMGADVEAPDEYGSTALMEACFCGRIAIAELLLAHGASVHARDNDGSTPLIHACVHGDEKLVGLLLEAGANPDAKNKWGLTPLSEASFWGHTRVVAQLLKYGANIDDEDANGRTALYWAGLEGKMEVVALLLENGAKVDREKTPGNGPVEWIPFQVHEVVAWLQKNKISVTSPK